MKSNQIKILGLCVFMLLATCAVYAIPFNGKTNSLVVAQGMIPDNISFLLKFPGGKFKSLSKESDEVGTWYIIKYTKKDISKLKNFMETNGWFFSHKLQFAPEEVTYFRDDASEIIVKVYPEVIIFSYNESDYKL